jgi:prepilin-type processing-associated H-X9-DG protein
MMACLVWLVAGLERPAHVIWTNANRTADSLNRHGKGANYIHTDSHVEHLRWRKARYDQYPDHRVRGPLSKPPE